MIKHDTKKIKYYKDQLPKKINMQICSKDNWFIYTDQNKITNDYMYETGYFNIVI